MRQKRSRASSTSSTRWIPRSSNSVRPCSTAGRSSRPPKARSKSISSATISGNTYLGLDAGSTGSVTLTGSGSQWTTTGDFAGDGEGAGAEVSIAGATALTEKFAYIGLDAGSHRTVTLSGLGNISPICPIGPIRPIVFPTNAHYGYFSLALLQIVVILPSGYLSVQ